MRRAVREGRTIGLAGRLVLMVLGLSLSDGLESHDLLSLLVGVAGLVLFLAAIGVVELAMAVWYRAHRHA